MVVTAGRLVVCGYMRGDGYRWSGLPVACQSENGVELEGLTVAIPPALFTLMARAEIDFGPIR